MCESFAGVEAWVVGGNIMTLFSFGYEGLRIDEFVARLQGVGVRVVLDVRQLPLSRKPGFSKSALAARLRKSGIAYRHIPALGCPRLIRDRYKSDGDWPAYARAFRAYLAGQEDALAEVARIAGKIEACLVCFEADHKLCHRSLVARAIPRSEGITVRHLTLTGEFPDPVNQAAA
jgi:uncharacterized protein (DUF488 family)